MLRAMILTAVALLAFPELAAADPPSERQSCTAKAGLRFYSERVNHWRSMMGAAPVRHLAAATASCPRYLATVVRSQARSARKQYGLWAAERLLRDFEVSAGSNAWLRAIEQAQRPYPGTRDWLRSCSSPRSEGGWGRWVPNTQGSGAGGWLQFMESTFWRMYGAARAEVIAEGYRVPGSSSSWYSPLGQALAGAWAVEHGATGEWSGQGC